MTAPLAERLRTGTRAWHDALEATPFAAALLAGTLPLDRYVGQLAAYRVVLDALEDEAAHADCPSVASVWSADLAKVPLLDRDLRHFAASGTAVTAPATGPARAFAREIRRTAATRPETLLGYLYVLEGSTMGALILRRYVTAAYGLGEGDGTAYYGSGDRSRWTALTARLNEALTDPEPQTHVLAAAHRAYHHTAAITHALSAGLPRIDGAA